MPTAPKHNYRDPDETLANDHVRLKDVGIHGNGHMMMLEKNNLEIAAYMDDWLRAKLAATPGTAHDRN